MWKDEFYLSNAYDTGTYSIKVVSSVDDVLNPVFNSKYTYEIVSITLKQPEMSITTVEDIVVKGEKTSIAGFATGTDTVMYYIFGTNTFATSTAEVYENEYVIEFDTSDLDSGRYDIVVQHPMYDGYFNVGADQTTGNVYLNPVGNYASGSIEFNIYTKQSANAEIALCALLDGANIDDTYLTTTFNVINPTFALNSVSDTIYLGDSLKISGTTNLPVGDTVTVQVSSIAFDISDKLTAGNAINLIKVATVVKGDTVNTWSVTFNGLPLGDYNIVATVTDITTLTESGLCSVIVAPTVTATPTANPTANPTTNPTTSTKTPGFGTLIALVGLGAVAVLVLRRD